jgi:hypothetical protein
MADMKIILTPQEINTILLNKVLDHYELDVTDEDFDVDFEIITSTDTAFIRHATITIRNVVDFETENF